MDELCELLQDVHQREQRSIECEYGHSLVRPNPGGQSMSEYLTSPDLHTLTGYARSPLQADWLVQHGIPHRVDGRRIIVSRVHVQAWLEGRTVARSNGLNLAAIK